MVEGIIFSLKNLVMFGVGFCFLAVMYVLSTDVVVERNEKKSDDVGMDLP